MISFVWTPSSTWTPPFPLIPNNGGTERFTLGQCRELNKRGIANQIITFYLGKNDGRKYSPDINFVDFASPKDVGRLDDYVVLVTEPLDVETTQPPFIMMHCPPYLDRTKHFYQKNYNNRRLISNSHGSARLWAEYLGISRGDIEVMYPFADKCFGAEPVPRRADGPAQVLFAGRLTIEKGFYTFLEALHFFANEKDIKFNILLTGSQNEEFNIISKLVKAHPMLNALSPRTTPKEMAQLLVTQDVVVMPSHSQLWPEPFGMLSVEAQHSGCQVVASDVGGLPETDCGGLHLFDADNPVKLANAIRRAVRKGRMTPTERATAAKKFTVEQSVDKLLKILKSDLPVYKFS